MAQLPPKPTSQYMDSPDIAIAQAIQKLTDRELSIEMLSCIEESDVPRLNLLLSIGQDSSLKVQFVEEYAHRELRLMCSTKQKKHAGIRSEQIVEVAKQPPMMAQQDGGFLGKLFGNRGK
jgi:hypothetical protein